MIQSRRRLAIVGNGMVTATFLEELVARSPDSFEITVFGGEPHPAYDRIKLSTFLAGGCSRDSLTLLERSWYRRHGVNLREGCAVTVMDRESRILRDSAGEETPYDVCVLATGSDPILLPVEGKDRQGVHTFRTIEDVERMLARADEGIRAVVIGGGLLGLEAAYGLRRRGAEVSVIHLVDRLMERQLDAAGARILRTELESMGMTVVLPAQTAAFLGNGRVEAVSLADGRRLPADLVVVACGIRPAAGLARLCGLDVNRGVVVDDQLRTSDAAVYAIGECGEHRGVIYGIVAPLRLQARTLAAHLCGDEKAAYLGGVTATTLKVAGVNVFSAGAVDQEENDEFVTLEDTGTGVYKKVLIREGRPRGAILVGDLSTAPAITLAMTEGRALNGERLALVAAPAGEASANVAASLADEAIVCGCNGVTKATIACAIREKGCASRAEVTRCTRAAGSCGSCGNIVDALLAETGKAPAGGASGMATFCTCLPMVREDLRSAIVENELRSVQAVLQALGNGTGCARCKPALSYLLDVLWCGEHEEDRSARFVNDRVHANIQKDATFSVVPRMMGGVTNPAELRRIADVAERFNVPMVKVTGSQRLDLLGVRKEDLPEIWKALDMPSGHAYAKAVRMVKTCVGSDFCRFGVGDSTALGIALETMLFGLHTPHKLKAGVSGCPRNCAEITVKDLGIMAIATGWEIYVGGAAGMSVRKGDLLSTVTTAEAALDHALLFVQHYREEADYLQRAYHHLERVGIDHVRRATVGATEEIQQGLRARFWRARSNVKDPWLEGRSPRSPLQFESRAGHEHGRVEVEPMGEGRPTAGDRGHRLLASLPLSVR